MATSKVVIKIHYMIMFDRRITERRITSAVGISQEKVNSITTEDLDVGKVSAIL